ncbi:hypothetical protein C8035_v008921 [Colletotrichum spinosum]|uniref:Uncharacterized protein n=1 Tax=Colletotrichum spinosum TaxID=1347390 RepID=A0A4R8PSR0_9PEZI|nr:hypothetical protein C8035_v008921 [Colletotrichum spinosum]
MSGSGSPSRSQRRPLHERSKSQSNSLAIRVVPYSPPRPTRKNRDSTASASSSRTPTSTTALLSPYPSELGHVTDDRSARRASDAYSHRRSYSSGTLTSVLSPASSTFPPVAAKDRGVSGSKLLSDSWTGSPSSPCTPVPATPSHQTDNSLNARSRSSQTHRDDESATQSARRPLSRRRNLITINADGKTFSLLPQGQRNRDSSGNRASRTPTFSTSTSASQGERLSSDGFSENHPSSTPTSFPDRSFPSTLTPASSTTQLASDHIVSTAGSSSPWNYRMVGGLRKVPNTPDLKQKQKATLLYPKPDQGSPRPSSPSENRLAPLPEAPATNLSSSKKPCDLQPKTSFQSSITASTASDNTNYKIHSSSSPPRAETDSVLPPPSITSETTNYKGYGSSSPPAPDTDGSLLPPSSSHSNYEILGRSSPPEPSSAERSPPKTADSEQNYVIHDDWSPAPSAVTARHQKLRPVYSEESLLVAALKPQKDKKKSRERFGYYKSRSRDSLRRTASSKILSAALGLETGPKGTAAPDTFYQARVLAGVLGVQPDARAEINTIAAFKDATLELLLKHIVGPQLTFLGKFAG